MASVDLVLVAADDAKPAAWAEFLARGRDLADLWGPDSHMALVADGRDIVRAIEEAPAPIRRLGLVMHGFWNWLLAPRRGVLMDVDAPPGIISPTLFADRLAPRASPELLVSLAACWTGFGRRPSVAERMSGGWMGGGQAYGPGPEGGLADALWRRLAQSLPAVQLIAHSTRGHTTRNPALRAWGPRWGSSASLCDHYLGPGAHRTKLGRREWVDLCLRRESSDAPCGAEMLLAGMVPPWLGGPA